MSYSRRHRFADGRSGLSRLDFAREFAVVLRPRQDADKGHGPEQPREREAPVRAHPGL